MFCLFCLLRRLIVFYKRHFARGKLHCISLEARRVLHLGSAAVIFASRHAAVVPVSGQHTPSANGYSKEQQRSGPLAGRVYWSIGVLSIRDQPSHGPSCAGPSPGTRQVEASEIS